jgi:hypothetical protein
VTIKQRYQVRISYKFVALENLEYDVHIYRTLESITENIKCSVTESVGYYKMKQRKSQFDEECSEL